MNNSNNAANIFLPFTLSEACKIYSKYMVAYFTSAKITSFSLKIRLKVRQWRKF